MALAFRFLRSAGGEKGFLSAEQAAALTEQEVVDLIFLPGFQPTASSPTSLVRGVDMDVVKQCVIDDLQGVVNVETRPGAGTHFSLRLPLSLAVMRVLLVEVNGLSFGFSAVHSRVAATHAKIC